MSEQSKFHSRTRFTARVEARAPLGARSTASMLLMGALLASAVGCGAAMAPKELVSARDAFAKAKQDETAQFAPAQLEEGRQALERADDTFDRRGDKPETRDQAYLALRKIQIATAVAAVEAAQRQKVKAQKDLEELRKKLLNTTEQQLAEEKRRAEKLKEGVALTQAELEKERKARETAEGKLSAALASIDKLAQVKEEKRGIVITLSGAVLFTTGKWDLLPIAQQKLDEVAKALKDQGYKKLVVEGHTDSRGSDSANQELSRKRAESVRSYLVSRGIESDKITAEGIGEMRPVADNATEEGRANNRRVEIIVTPDS